MKNLLKITQLIHDKVGFKSGNVTREPTRFTWHYLCWFV